MNIDIVKCHCCDYEDEEGAFHDIDHMMICDDCYKRDQPYKCVDCDFESFERDFFVENRNEDYECKECRENGRNCGLMKFYMCSR